MRKIAYLLITALWLGLVLSVLPLANTAASTGGQVVAAKPTHEKTPGGNTNGPMDKQGGNAPQQTGKHEEKATEQFEKHEEKATEQAEKHEIKATEQVEKHVEKATQQAGEDKHPGKKMVLRGTVVRADAASLVVALGGGQNVTLGINEQTRIHIPSLGKTAGPADLQPGVQVSVTALEAKTDHTLIAVTIMVIPGKPIRIHHVGIVTEYIPGASITIQGNDGSLTTFLLTPETKILPAERAATLAPGLRVTIISPRDVTGGALTAKGIVVHPLSQGTPFPTATQTETPTPTPTPTNTLTPTATPTSIP